MQFVVVALIVALGLTMVIAAATGTGGAGLFATITGHQAKTTRTDWAAAGGAAGSAAGTLGDGVVNQLRTVTGPTGMPA